MFNKNSKLEEANQKVRKCIRLKFAPGQVVDGFEKAGQLEQRDRSQNDQ
jgi:hypothetical protein